MTRCLTSCFQVTWRKEGDNHPLTIGLYTFVTRCVTWFLVTCFQVTWRKEGDNHPLTIGLYTFVNDKRVSVDFNSRRNEWSLIIEAVTPHDQGVYHCAVITRHDRDNAYQITLNVKSTSQWCSAHTFAALCSHTSTSCLHYAPIQARLGFVLAPHSVKTL